MQGWLEGERSRSKGQTLKPLMSLQQHRNDQDVAGLGWEKGRSCCSTDIEDFHFHSEELFAEGLWLLLLLLLLKTSLLFGLAARIIKVVSIPVFMSLCKVESQSRRRRCAFEQFESCLSTCVTFCEAFAKTWNFDWFRVNRGKTELVWTNGTPISRLPFEKVRVVETVEDTLPAGNVSYCRFRRAPRRIQS